MSSCGGQEGAIIHLSGINLVNYSTLDVLKTYLELILIKDLDQILWNQFKESLNTKIRQTFSLILYFLMV